MSVGVNAGLANFGTTQVVFLDLVLLVVDVDEELVMFVVAVMLMLPVVAVLLVSVVLMVRPVLTLPLMLVFFDRPCLDLLKYVCEAP